MIAVGGRCEVSVILLTRNAGPDLRRTLERVCSQKTGRAYEVIVIDSGSTDGTVEMARAFPTQIVPIEPGEFDHSHTRNLGAALSSGRFLVFLTQDAIPANETWLEPLVEAVQRGERTAGAYGRVLPLEGASFQARRGTLRDINARGEPIDQGPLSADEFRGLNPFERRLAANFNDVSSCIRRDVWERIPYPRVGWGEDLAWGRAVVEAGYRIRFQPESVVLHSHEYSLPELYRRTWIDGRANKEILDRDCVRGFGDVIRLTARLTSEDWKALRFEKSPLKSRIRESVRAPLHHFTGMLGLWRGGRTRFEEFGIAPVDRARLRILFVVHGFPPQTLAGTEIYTLNLIRELRDRHDIAVLHRVQDPSRENYSLGEDEFDRIPVFQIVNNLDYGGIEETVVNEKVEEKFRWVLDHFRPDIVHFQHCLHLSVSLVSAARARGIPAVVTLHDYWFICPKVQLIRPDRKVCRTSKPGLVCVGCSTNPRPAIRVARALRAVAPPLMEAGIAAYARLVRRVPRLRRRMLLDAAALRTRLDAVRRHLDAASMLVSPSQFLKDRYVRYGFATHRILFSRNGLATKGLERVRKVPSRKVRFAFTGSLLWYKGVDVLLRAFQSVDSNRAELAIWGDYEKNPEARRHFEEELRPIECSPSVRFMGAFRNDDLGAVYAQTDVLVVPSIWYENSPLTIQEAFAARTPVIASRLGAMKDLVRDGVNGLLFAPGDPADLAARMQRIVEEPRLLDRLRKGIPGVKTIGVNAVELEALYRQAICSLGGVRSGDAAPSLPLLELWGKSYSRRRGQVRRQGQDLVLLEPVPGGESAVTYVLRPTGAKGELRVEIETEVLHGEPHIPLGGTVFLNGREVGSIPVHAFERGRSRRNRYRFECLFGSGDNTLEITNRSPGASGRGTYLRIKRILVFRGDASGGGISV